MISLEDLLSVVICIGPLIVFVAVMAWATRRRRCPHCNLGVSKRADACPSCGQPLPPPSS